jgi:hypothetical protein
MRNWELRMKNGDEVTARRIKITPVAQRAQRNETCG